ALLVIALWASSGGPLGVFASHFRSGIVTYALNREDSTLLDVTVTTTWRYPSENSYKLSAYLRTSVGDDTRLFKTSSDDVVSYGQDLLYKGYIMLRTTRSIPVPTDLPATIYISDCCRALNLVGFGDYSGYDDYSYFTFSTQYVAEAPQSIIVDVPPVTITVNAAPGHYAYFFVPAISPTGAPIICSINRALAFTAP
ncbi:hypothetical protein VaNZ11_006718, partial [Volvox africanus]